MSELRIFFAGSFLTASLILGRKICRQIAVIITPIPEANGVDLSLGKFPDYHELIISPNYAR